MKDITETVKTLIEVLRSLDNTLKGLTQEMKERRTATKPPPTLQG